MYNICTYTFYHETSTNTYRHLKKLYKNQFVLKYRASCEFCLKNKRKDAFNSRYRSANLSHLIVFLIIYEICTMRENHPVRAETINRCHFVVRFFCASLDPEKALLFYDECCSLF